MSLASFVGLGLAGGVLAASAADGLAELGYRQIKQAEFVLVDSQRPPDADAPWRLIALPDRWAADQRWREGDSGWYRIALPPGAPAQPWVVYLQRLSVNVRVFLNSEYLGSGGSFVEPISRNMHRPLLFGMPASAWHPADSGKTNYLYLQLRVYPNFAHLHAMRVGLDAVLRPQYERQFFTQVTLSQLLFTGALLAGVFGLAFYLFVERQTVNLFFALTAFSWSVYCLNLFMRDIPFSAQSWWAMIHVNLEWAAVFLSFFAHRLVGVKRPLYERFLVAFAIGATIIYALAGIEHINMVSRRIHMVTMVLMLVLTGWLFWHWIRQRSTDALVLGCCLVGVVVLGLNDLVRHTVPIDSPNWQTRFYLLQFGAPVMFVVLATYLTGRYTRALRHANRADLLAQEARVEERLRERERIYQDLHDDVGAKLLTLVYNSKTEADAAIARSALADIRDIVSGRSLDPGSLSVALNEWHAEADARCQSAQIRLIFVADIDEAVIAPGEVLYHLGKILRELLSNSLRHGAASQLSLTATVLGTDLLVEFKDDGRGLPPDVKPGRGLAGIRRRVDALGGEVTFGSGEPGLAVHLLLPLEPGHGKPAAAG